MRGPNTGCATGAVRRRLWLPSILVVAGCLLWAACTAHPSDPPSTSAQIQVFRYVDIAPYGRLVLGSQFAAESVAHRASDSVYILKAGTFGGAREIRVYVSPGRKIVAFEFDYSGSTEYASLLASYSKDLGPPSGTSLDQDGTARMYWVDRKTRFELVRLGGDRVSRLRSRLTDLIP